MKLKLFLILCLIFQANLALASEWSIVVYKTSLKVDCPEICGLEIFRNGELVVSDLRVTVRDPEQVSVQEKNVIEAALKFEGVREPYEEIVKAARIIDEVD